jgi:hypothetical protein
MSRPTKLSTEILYCHHHEVMIKADSPTCAYYEYKIQPMLQARDKN